MNCPQLIKILREDLSKYNSKFETIKFFRRNLTSYWVWICILDRYYNNGNVENIIREIPSEYASRPTLFKIIDAAVKKKYLKKELDKFDKRKYNLSPASQTIKEFKDWAKIFLPL